MKVKRETKRKIIIAAAVISFAMAVLNGALTVRAAEGYIANTFEARIGEAMAELARD